MSLPSHVEWIADHMGSQLEAELVRQGARLSAEAALGILCDADPTPKLRSVQWMAERLIDGGFLWEDVAAGSGSKVHETLVAFGVHRRSMLAGQRNLADHGTLASVWKAVEPFQAREVDTDEPGIRERRRREKVAAYAESTILCDTPGLTVAVPLTEGASKWWGRGTRWCTAAENGNAFAAYDRYEPLVVIVIDGVKMQMYANDTWSCLMDADDVPVDTGFVAERWDRLAAPILWALPKGPVLLKYVPQAHIDPDMCMQAVARNGWALEFVPEEIKNQKLCLKAMQSWCSAMGFVPQSLRGRSILEFVPESLRDRAMYKKSVEASGNSVKFVPQALMTPRMCMTAVKANGWAIGLLPPEIITRAMCLKAVSNRYAFEHVPSEMRDRRVCDKAVSKGGALRWAPKPVRHRRMCLKALSIDPMALQHVPADIVDRRMCLRAVSKMGLALEHVPHGFRDVAMCRRAVSASGRALEFVPEDIVDPRMCVAAVANDASAIEFVPEAEKIGLGSSTTPVSFVSWIPARLRPGLLYLDVLSCVHALMSISGMCRQSSSATPRERHISVLGDSMASLSGVARN